MAGAQSSRSAVAQSEGGRAAGLRIIAPAWAETALLAPGEATSAALVHSFGGPISLPYRTCRLGSRHGRRFARRASLRCLRRCRFRRRRPAAARRSALRTATAPEIRPPSPARDAPRPRAGVGPVRDRDRRTGGADRVGPAPGSGGARLRRRQGQRQHGARLRLRLEAVLPLVPPPGFWRRRPGAAG